MNTVPEVTPDWLASHPLPSSDPAGDKETRGHVMVIAGSPEMPGAALLSAVAAMRAGAGKLSIATAASVAPALAVACPEARVIAWGETPAGGLAPDAGPAFDAVLQAASAILVGPGMADAAAAEALGSQLIDRFRDTPIVLDAMALGAVKGHTGAHPRLLITPHAGELATLLGVAKEDVLADPAGTARRAAGAWHAFVLLKGAITVLAGPDGPCWSHTSHHPGLGVSGSGDALAGLIAGLLARGASPERAAAWGVAAHAGSAARLEERVGELGYLARELVDEIPLALAALQAPGGEPPRAVNEPKPPSFAQPD